MTNIGEVKKASEIGYVGNSAFIWSACPGCGTERWVYLRLKENLCRPCAAWTRTRKLFPITFSGQGTPHIGDIAVAKSLGYADRRLRYFVACPSCHVGRWVKRNQINNVCIQCAHKCKGVQHPRYKPSYNKRGYVYVHISEDDPLFVMTNSNGLVREHRLVVARRLGRPLRTNEVVHHINGIKHDNRDTNLRLLLEKEHNSHLVLKETQVQICQLETRVTMLEADNALLRSQLGN